MFASNTRSFYIFVIAFFSSVNGFAQFYNAEIEAKIEVENNNEFIKITGTAFNKSAISQSLRYVLSVVTRNSEEYDDVSKEDKEDRFVLEPLQKINLATTVINSSETKRIIVLLLVYNLDDKIIGKDRIIFNDFDDGSPAERINNEIIDRAESTTDYPDVDNKNKDGIVLRGIVVEDTKTKPGRDFYAKFYSDYTLNKINSDKVIVVKEVMALGTNTKIELKVDDVTIFEFFVRPNMEYIREMADFSIKRVYYYLQQLERQKNIVNKY